MTRTIQTEVRLNQTILLENGSTDVVANFDISS